MIGINAKFLLSTGLGGSLFQALGQWGRSNKATGDE